MNSNHAAIILASLLLVLPTTGLAQAQAPVNDLVVPAYPPEIVALLDGYVAAAEERGAAHSESAWYPEAARFLINASAARDDGRFRVSLFHLETFNEIVAANLVMAKADEASSTPDKKRVITRETNIIAAEAEEAWQTFRTRLDAEPVASVKALETAFFAADLALSAELLVLQHKAFAEEFLKAEQPYHRDWALALARHSTTPLLMLAVANDVLDVALSQDGVQPRINAAEWANVTAIATRPTGTEGVPAHLDALEKLARPVRAAGEGTMAIAIAFAEERASREQGISTIFGDAATRGKDVVNDAASGMAKQARNLTTETAIAVGGQGLFGITAIDTAAFTLSFVVREEGELGFVIASWAALDHAGYVDTILDRVSPLDAPTPQDDTPDNTEDGKTTPAPGFALLGIAITIVAWSAARKRRA